MSDSSDGDDDTRAMGAAGPAPPDGNACPTALLLIDVINDLGFEGSERMLPAALEAADRIHALKQRARRAGVPIIYVNDNFGHWRSDFREIARRIREDGKHGRELVGLLHPDDDDYFVLKPRHSAFYNTTLETLLRYLRTRRLILTGFSGHVCVLMSASDAYIREFELIVPRDCIASPTAEQNEAALQYMAEAFSVSTQASTELDLEKLAVPSASVAQFAVDDV